MSSIATTLRPVFRTIDHRITTIGQNKPLAIIVTAIALVGIAKLSGLYGLVATGALFLGYILLHDWCFEAQRQANLNGAQDRFRNPHNQPPTQVELQRGVADIGEPSQNHINFIVGMEEIQKRVESEKVMTLDKARAYKQEFVNFLKNPQWLFSDYDKAMDADIVYKDKLKKINNLIKELSTK